MSDPRRGPASTLVVRDKSTTSSVAQHAPVKAGDVFGSYRIIKELGAGSIGRVYLAEHVHLGRRVALKMLRPELSNDPKLVRRFFAEARAVNEIAHQNIVTITDFVIGEDHPSFYIMELLEGLTLERLIAIEGRLSLRVVLDIGAQLASALAAAHDKGIVHRDLKPSNVFLVPDDHGAHQVRLLDFGVAKFSKVEFGAKPNTQIGSLIGTPGYMSPEASWGIEVDLRADLYALGVVLYEALTGARPGEVPARLPYEPVDQLIRFCLEKSPADRPDNAHEVRARLRQISRALKPTTARWPVPIFAMLTAIMLLLATWLLTRKPEDRSTVIIPAIGTSSPVDEAPVLEPDPDPSPEPKRAKPRKKKKRRSAVVFERPAEKVDEEKVDEEIDRAETWSPFE